MNNSKTINLPSWSNVHRLPSLTCAKHYTVFNIVFATFLYSGIMTFIILKVLDIIPGLGLQEPENIEMSGLDANVHGERGYVSDGAD